MKKEIKSIAFGSIIVTISVILTFGGQFFALTKFAGPLLAGMLLVFQKDLFGTRSAVAVWVAASVLMLLIVQKKTGVLTYIFLLGYYPCLHVELYRLKNLIVNILIKFLLLTSVGIAAFLSASLFAGNFDFSAISSKYMVIALIVLYYLFFLVYDLFFYYFYRLCLKEWIKKFDKII